MISASQLKELIQHYRHQPNVFSSELSEHSRSVMEDISEFTFLYLENVAAELEAGVSQAEQAEMQDSIETFFANRWAAIKWSNITYTRHPFLPANQLCLKLAAAIAGPKQPICSLLMPQVTSLNRNSFSFKAETEDDGFFQAEEFILNQHGTRLIPVAEIFQTGKFNTNAIFPEFQPDTNEVQYQMTTRDFLSLEKVAGAASENYIRALRRRHEASFDNGSIGFAIKTLAIALKKGSVSDAGTEMVANHDIIDAPIKTFYDIWRGLDETIRTQVCAYPLTGYGYGHVHIDSYFLVVFSGHKDCVLTKQEEERVIADKLTPCMYQLSLSLDEFLNLHPILYSIPLTSAHAAASSSEAAPDNLDDLLKLALDELKIRPQFLESKGNDNYLFDYLIHYLVERCSVLPTALKTFSARLSEHIFRIPNPQNLSAYQKELYTKLISYVDPNKLNELIPAGTFHIWMPWLSGQQQLALIAPRFEELLPHCQSLADYKTRVAIMPAAVKEAFFRLYAQKITSHITSHTHVCQLIKNYPHLSNLLFESVQDRLTFLNPEFADILFILNSLNSENKKKLVERHADIILPLINPARYPKFHDTMGEHTPFFTDKLAPYLTDNISTLDDCLMVLHAWSTYAMPQRSLLNELDSRLTVWITDIGSLMQLLPSVYPADRLGTVVPFLHLVDSRPALLACLAYIPAVHRSGFLCEFSLPLFIKNLAALKELACLLPMEEACSLVDKFDPASLNCTREELNAIKPPKPVSTITPPLRKLINELRVNLRGNPMFFFSGYPGSESDRETRNLINTLENSTISYQKKIDAVRTLKSTIDARHSHRSLSSNLTSNILSSFLRDAGEEESYAFFRMP